MISEDRRRTEKWLDGAAACVGITISDTYREHVVAQLELNESLIKPLLQFDLPTTDTDK
jgi:hypothetical protein